MPEFILQALEYGVLGLCAITLVLVWRVLVAEQHRDGAPRKGILQASYAFMAFSFFLAAMNAYVQLNQGNNESVSELEVSLREKEDQLLRIQSAARPILMARSNIIDNLPPGPERDTLKTLVEALRETLNDP